MSYLMIQNKGELPIWGIRLLGLSSKEEGQIGQFGTGLKESISLLVRIGAPPIIYCGTCRVEFTIRTVHGQEEIHFLLSEKKGDFAAGIWYGLGLHKNFGQIDWVDPWMALRELFCNAIDECGVDLLYHDIVSTQPVGIEGCTRFYIPNTRDILSAYSVIHDKLLMLGDSKVCHTTQDAGNAIEKRSSEHVNIYHKGVWVQKVDLDSLYDYELDNISLNECRLADAHDVRIEMAYVVAGFSKPMISKLLSIITNEQATAYVELAIMYHIGSEVRRHDKQKETWKAAWDNVFGTNAVIVSSCNGTDYDKLIRNGHKPIAIVCSSMRRLLVDICGVPDISTALTNEQNLFDVVYEPSEKECVVFNGVWNKFKEHNLIGSKTQPKLTLFKPHTHNTSALYGCYINDVCYVNKEYIGSEWEVYTCIEEIAHHLSGASDLSIDFQMYLLKIAGHFSGMVS